MALDSLDLLKRSEVGAPLTALQHDQNLTAIESAFNALRAAFLVAHNTDGTLKSSILPTPGADGTVLTSTGEGATPAWEATAVAGTEAVGFTKIWWSATPPEKFLLCDGTIYSVATYPALAAYLGSTFGGDGTSTFAVPDTRGRAITGIGTGTAPDATVWAIGQKRGAETHSLALAEGPNHTHAVGYISFSDGRQTGIDLGLTPAGYSNIGTRTTESSGSGSAHNNLGPRIGAALVIRYET